MARLRGDEIEPGLVAFLDHAMLEADDRVISTKVIPPGDIGDRTFVCFDVQGDISYWSPTTTQQRRAGYQRLEIVTEWRTDGHPQWLNDSQYLNDGANTYRGPIESFIAASHRESTEHGTRARITQVGLDAIRAEIQAQIERRD